MVSAAMAQKGGTANPKNCPLPKALAFVVYMDPKCSDDKDNTVITVMSDYSPSFVMHKT